MAQVLHIEEVVVTGEVLSRKHQGQEEVQVGEKAVVTPTAWDYLRQQRLRLSRGGAAQAAPRGPAREGLIQEVPPRQQGQGRCAQPDRAWGCKDEEFGSGFVEPAACQDCAVQVLKKQGDKSACCEGCNRNKTLQQLIRAGQGVDAEQVVRQVVELIARQLGN
jgi:hypothetical protein